MAIYSRNLAGALCAGLFLRASMFSNLIYHSRKLFFFLLLSLIQGKALWACAVCGTAIEASRKAFIYSTALLSLAPLIMMGFLFFYFFRKYRNQEETQSEHNASANNNIAESKIDN